MILLESSLGLTVSLAPDAGGCPFPVEQSAVMEHQWLMHPLPYLLGLAEITGVDLESEILRKMEKNRKRVYRRLENGVLVKVEDAENKEETK